MRAKRTSKRPEAGREARPRLLPIDVLCRPMPFEVAAVLLLVAIIAAITLTMRNRPGYKRQDISAQVNTRAAARVRIVKVESARRP